MALQKKNKKKICYHHITLIKKDYFTWCSPMMIAEKYWYDYLCMQKYLDSSATKNYTDEEWTWWRRCKNCCIYKIAKNNFYIQPGRIWKKNRQPNCKSCKKVMARNRFIMKKNMDDHYDYIYWNRKDYWKNWWRYNYRKRLMRIIWYLDSHWRVVSK